MLPIYREKFLKALIGFSLVAYQTERELTKAQAKRKLTADEEDRLKAATKATNYAERRRHEFASHGVIGAGQDLASLPWWPTPSESAKIVMKLMLHAARARLDLDRFDPDLLDLSQVNFAKHRIRGMNPDYFVK